MKIVTFKTTDTVKRTDSLGRVLGENKHERCHIIFNTIPKEIIQSSFTKNTINLPEENCLQTYEKEGKWELLAIPIQYTVPARQIHTEYRHEYEHISTEDFDDVILDDPAEWYNVTYIPKRPRQEYSDDEFGTKRHAFVTEIINRLSSHEKAFLGTKNGNSYFMKNIKNEENCLRYECFFYKGS